MRTLYNSFCFVFTFSLFGKTCESPEKYTSIKICTSASQAETWMSEPHFKDWKRLSDHHSLFFFHQKKIKFNKPLYIAMNILENSKVRFYKGYYQEIQKVFPGINPNDPSRVQCLYSDTGK